jgi:hypothetical protein
MGKRCVQGRKAAAMSEGAQSVKGYRARAEQIRAEADAMTNLETRQALLHIAANYEQLAYRVEKSRSGR